MRDVLVKMAAEKGDTFNIETARNRFSAARRHSDLYQWPCTPQGYEVLYQYLVLGTGLPRVAQAIMGSVAQPPPPASAACHTAGGPAAAAGAAQTPAHAPIGRQQIGHASGVGMTAARAGPYTVSDSAEAEARAPSTATATGHKRSTQSKASPVLPSPVEAKAPRSSVVAAVPSQKQLAHHLSRHAHSAHHTATAAASGKQGGSSRGAFMTHWCLFEGQHCWCYHDVALSFARVCQRASVPVCQVLQVLQVFQVFQAF